MASVVVKLNIFKVLRTDSASMTWNFVGGFLDPYSPKYGPILLNKLDHVLNYFEGFDFLWKKYGPKVCIFGLTLTPGFPPEDG